MSEPVGIQDLKMISAKEKRPEGLSLDYSTSFFRTPSKPAVITEPTRMAMTY